MTREMGAAKNLRIISGVFLAACLATSPAAASQPEAGAPGRPVPESESAESTMTPTKIVVDPRPGEIVSVNAHEYRALSESLARALSRSVDGLEVFDLDSGGKGVHLGGRFQHVMTIKVKADGSLELGCVDSAVKAREILHGKATEADGASRDR